MANTITVGKIKDDQRITHSRLDDDISDTIDACLADLTACGVKAPDETDPLILSAIKLYCRAQATDDVNKGAAYMQRYDKLKACLQMAEGYGGEAHED
jgi:hypothetical protein